MKQETVLLETGQLEILKPVEQTTIEDMITALGINTKNCGVLVNGKSAPLSTVIGLEDEVTIIPHLAGG